MRGTFLAFVGCLMLVACTSSSERGGQAETVQGVDEGLAAVRARGFDGWTVRVSVEPSVVGPIVLSVGPVRRAARNNAHQWIQHDLVFENSGDRAVRFADTRTSAFIGHRMLIAADEGCGYARASRKSAIEAGVCLLYLDAFRVRPHRSVSRPITLFKGLRGMKPLASGTYVFEKLLRFQLGTSTPEEGSGRIVPVRLLYEIESAVS
jgi:hypothetical protein